MIKKAKRGDVLVTKVDAVVDRWLGSANAGCHGMQSIHRADDRGGIGIPGEDWLPPGTQVEVEVRVTIKKVGRALPRRCENPWPAHRCKKE